MPLSDRLLGTTARLEEKFDFLTNQSKVITIETDTSFLPSLKINYSDCPALKSAIMFIRKKEEEITDFPQESEVNDFTISLDNIIALFGKFDKYDFKNDNEKLIFETARVYLMKAVLQKLEEKNYSVESITAPQYPKKTPVSSNFFYNSFWRWIGFAMLMIVEFFPAFVGNLLYAGESMASLTPYLFFLSPHVMTAIGIISALSMLGGMVCFIGPVLMRWIGLSHSNNATSLLLVNQEQLEIADKINDQLLKYDTHKMLPCCETYQAYINFAKNIGMHLKSMPSQLNEESIYSKITTWVMTGLAAIQALSGSLFLAATVLGCITGAFTLATASPVILTAFVSSHMFSILAIAAPLALAQGMVSYILRVCSTSKLFDRLAGERDTVEKKRIKYINRQDGIKRQFDKIYQDKAMQDRLDRDYSAKRNSSENFTVADGKRTSSLNLPKLEAENTDGLTKQCLSFR